MKYKKVKKERLEYLFKSKLVAVRKLWFTGSFAHGVWQSLHQSSHRKKALPLNCLLESSLQFVKSGDHADFSPSDLLPCSKLFGSMLCNLPITGQASYFSYVEGITFLTVLSVKVSLKLSCSSGQVLC